MKSKNTYRDLKFNSFLSKGVNDPRLRRYWESLRSVDTKEKSTLTFSFLWRETLQGN